MKYLQQHCYSKIRHIKAKCGIYRNELTPFFFLFLEKLREIYILLNNTLGCLHEIFSGKSNFFCFSYTLISTLTQCGKTRNSVFKVWKNEKLSITEKNFVKSTI